MYIYTYKRVRVRKFKILGVCHFTYRLCNPGRDSNKERVFKIK